MDVQQTASPLKQVLNKSASFPLIPLVLVGFSVCCYTGLTLINWFMALFTNYSKITAESLFWTFVQFAAYALMLLGLFLYKKNGSLFLGIGFAVCALSPMMELAKNFFNLLSNLRWVSVSMLFGSLFTLTLLCVEIVAVLAIAASFFLGKFKLVNIVKISGCAAFFLVDCIWALRTTWNYIENARYMPVFLMLVLLVLLWFAVFCISLPRLAAVVLYKPYVGEDETAEVTEPIEVAEVTEAVEQ